MLVNLCRGSTSLTVAIQQEGIASVLQTNLAGAAAQKHSGNFFPSLSLIERLASGLIALFVYSFIYLDLKQSPGTPTSVANREQLTEILLLINELLPNLPSGIVPTFVVEPALAAPRRKLNLNANQFLGSARYFYL